MAPRGSQQRLLASAALVAGLAATVRGSVFENPASVKCLDIAGGGSENGAPLQLFDCNGSPGQRFDWKAGATSMSMTLVNPASGKCLDVEGGSTQAGAKVQLYTCNGSPAQMWAQKGGHGGHALLNTNSGKCMDIEGAGTQSGAKVQIYDCNLGPGQRWVEGADKVGLVSAYYEAATDRRRPPPYAYTPASAAGLPSGVDHLMYGHLFFCPPEGFPDPPYWAADACSGAKPNATFPLGVLASAEDLASMKQLRDLATEKNFKLLGSVGGPALPSALFSAMVALPTSRKAFVESVAELVNTTGLDGVDIDWRFAGSPPRTLEVKENCSLIHKVTDAGGDKADKANLAQLMQELRATLGAEKIITLRTPKCLKSAAANYDLLALEENVNHFNVLSYDYNTPLTTTANRTGPNQPLYPAAGMGNNYSVDTTVRGYLGMGVSPAKISLGLALHGHTWYAPGLKNETAWAKFGLPAQKQMACCGDFNKTYGARCGPGAQRCGLYTLGEIGESGCLTAHDSETQSDMMYCAPGNKTDKKTDGIWASYQSPKSLAGFVAYAEQYGLMGVYVSNVADDLVTAKGPSHATLQKIVTAAKGSHHHVSGPQQTAVLFV